MNSFDKYDMLKGYRMKSVRISIIKNNSEWLTKICFIGVIFYIVLAFSVCKVNESMSNLFFELSFCLLIAGTLIMLVYIKNTSLKTAIQCFSLGMLIFIFWVTNLLSVLNNNIEYNKINAYIGLTALAFFTIYWGLYLVKKISNYSKCLASFLTGNNYLIVLIFIYVLLYIPCFTHLFKSDSNVYYTTVCENAGKWDFTIHNIETLQMGYHLSYGYSLFIFIGQCLISTWGIGIRTANLLIFLVTLFCVNGILKDMFPQKHNNFYCSMLMLYIFNPLSMGIIQELNIDYAYACFFVWFVWAYLKDYHVFMIAFSFFLCFSKENAIITLFGFAFGALIYRTFLFIKNRKSSHLVSIATWREWILFFPSILLVINIKLLGNQWGKSSSSSAINDNGNIVNSINLNVEYMAIKCKQLFVLNFQWLVIVMIFLLLCYTIAKKVKFKFNENYFAIFFSYVFTLIFQLTYFTYPHYRYLQFNAFYLMIILGYILYYTKTKIGIYGIYLISVLYLIQSFYSIDLLSNTISRKVPTGNGTIISEAYYTDDPQKAYALISQKNGADLKYERFRDYVQNNRQYLGFEYCFEEFLKDIDYNSDKAIILSPIYNGLDYTIVNVFGTTDKDSLRWNKKFSQITYDDNDIKINWLEIYNTEENLEKYTEVWYVELPYDEEYKFQEIAPYMGQKRNYKFINWKINVYKLNNVNG